MRTDELKVWDLFVRVFHWTLVAAFGISWLTEDELMGVHSTAGYIVLGLVVARILWGFVGSRHARFGDFVQPPGRVLAYLKDVLAFRAKRYLGHNPAGGAMIVALLLSLLATTFTGMAAYGAGGGGPLSAWMFGFDPAGTEMFEDVHEFFANFTLLLVVVHVAGVIFESRFHGENLVRAMFTGRKAVETEKAAQP